jgi:hypothetical protein
MRVEMIAGTRYWGVGDDNRWDAISKGRDDLSAALLSADSRWGATFGCRGNDREDVFLKDERARRPLSGSRFGA